MTDAQRRRRRVRHPGAAESPEPGVGAEPVVADGPGVTADPTPGYLNAETSAVHDPEPADDRETERGLRGLVGSGASQVSTAAAMRARDAARPTDADLAAAEEHVVVVRRGWVPRDDLPRGGSR